MVSGGKVSREELNMIKRSESAHANAVGGYTLFVAGVLLALHAGVPTLRLSGLMAAYTLLRLLYMMTYIYIEKDIPSFLRTGCWYAGNICCFSMMVLAGKRL